MLISNGVIVTPFEVIKDKALLIKDGKIQAIVDKNEVDESAHELIDARGGYILPGFIDIHTHGGFGSDVMDATYEDFCNITRFHASHGVTAILATTLTAPVDFIIRSLEAVRSLKGKESGGAKILGVHLEGPFLSHGNKGAHLAEYLLTPDGQNYNFIFEYTDVIKSVTLSPGLPGVLDLIRKLAGNGIVVSGGHDTSVDEEIMEAIQCGMTHTTHAYCAMSSVRRINGKKHLGLNEMVLLDDRLSTEFIADNKHIPPLLVKLIYKCKGAKKACVVSDCLRAAGMPKDDTLYVIGPRDGVSGYHVVVDDGVASLPDRSMHAGSIIALDQMVGNLIRDCDIPLVDAVRMASLTPAEIIRIDSTKGSIETGKDADICIADKDFNIIATMVEGEFVYKQTQD